MEPLENTSATQLRQALRVFGVSPKRGLKKEELYDLLSKRLAKLVAVPEQDGRGPDDERCVEEAASIEKNAAATRIQAVWRGRQTRLILSLRGAPALNRALCNNAVDPITLEPLCDIALDDFFSYRGQDGIHYGFRIESAHQCLRQCKGQNPFTRQSFEEDVVELIEACWEVSRDLSAASKRKQEHPPVTNQRVDPLHWYHSMDIRRRTTEVFDDFLDRSGIFIEPSSFCDMDLHDMQLFFSVLEVRAFECGCRFAEELSYAARDLQLGSEYYYTAHATYWAHDWSTELAPEYVKKELIHVLENFVERAACEQNGRMRSIRIISTSLAACTGRPRFEPL